MISFFMAAPLLGLAKLIYEISTIKLLHFTKKKVSRVWQKQQLNAVHVNILIITNKQLKLKFNVEIVKVKVPPIQQL